MDKLNNYFNVLDTYFYDDLTLDLYPEILLLDAQIQILYKLSKDIEITNITEIEIINISENDKDCYYLENFDLTRMDKIPYSILFLNHL